MPSATPDDDARDAAHLLALLRSATRGMRHTELRATTDLPESRLGTVLHALQRDGSVHHRDGLWTAAGSGRG